MFLQSGGNKKYVGFYVGIKIFTLYQSLFDKSMMMVLCPALPLAIVLIVVVIVVTVIVTVAVAVTAAVGVAVAIFSSLLLVDCCLCPRRRCRRSLPPPPLSSLLPHTITITIVTIAASI